MIYEKNDPWYVKDSEFLYGVGAFLVFIGIVAFALLYT